MALVEVVVAVIDQNYNLLKPLMVAAFALPGMVQTVNAAEAEYVDFNSQFTRYEESGNRMKIDVYQASSLFKLTDQLTFKVNGVKDVISGASPVTYTPDTGNPNESDNSTGLIPDSATTTPTAAPLPTIKNTKAILIKSGASIRDVRDAVDITGTYTHDHGSFDLGVGRSSENDYQSNFFNIDSRLDLNNKLTTVETGYGFSSDTVWAIDHCPPHCLNSNSSSSNSLENITPNNPSSANSISPDTDPKGVYHRPNVGGDKSTHQGILGVTQIINKNSLMQANLTYSYNEGYLSDPYKEVYTPWVTTPMPPYAPTGGYSHDSRPSSRHQIALLGRYVHHFADLNAASVHIDYRFYIDNWGLDAHTFELTWLQPIMDNWRLSPTFRYYSQNSANFYQPYFLTPRADGYYSSDYRLAQFGAISGGVQLTREFFETITVGLGINFYDRKQTYAFNNGIGTNADDFSFSMMTAKFNVKF